MKKFIARPALASLAILFLLGGTTAAFANTQRNTISLVGVGGSTVIGNQQYAVAGGQVAYAYIDGQMVNNARILYGYTASQTGSTTSGSGTILLTGTITGMGRVTVSGTFNIDDNVNAIPPGEGISGDLPYYFVSDAPDIQTTVAGTTTQLETPLMVENPYFNPFGAPILIASLDGTIAIAATYSLGTIYWTDGQVQALMSGTYGTSPASGVLTLTGNEFEDLVAGTAVDQGQTSWSDMSPSQLNANGNYQGSDYIPMAGEIPCSPANAPETCTETGFQSQGTFSAGAIHGSYSTAWTVPALGFTTTITATVSPSGNGQGNQGQNVVSWFLSIFSSL